VLTSGGPRAGDRRRRHPLDAAEVLNDIATQVSPHLGSSVIGAMSWT